VLRHAPEVWVVRALRRTYRDVLRPIFGSIGVIDLLVISAAAGLGEELLFRAGLQPVLGLVATSVVFGVVHVFSLDSISIGLWALVAGLAFGWLMNVTGGLTAPVLAHATYDALALAYIRWGPADV
jgi:membrane protease YdiL (CAAX protease family)